MFPYVKWAYSSTSCLEGTELGTLGLLRGTFSSNAFGPLVIVTAYNRMRFVERPH